MSERVLAQLLEEHGYCVHVVGNGLEALQALQSGMEPMLILLDLKMPVMDGWEFRRRQVQDPLLAHIPVVVLSAWSDEEAPVDQLGDVGYLQQLVQAEDLFASIERFSTTPKPEILLVEDDSDVRKCVALVLRHHGFTVHQASSGREAVQLYQRYHPCIHLVLLDVQMPGMSGAQTFALLKEIDPAVRVVFMSGRTGPYSPEQLVKMGAIQVLQKPFRSIVELATTLWIVATDSQ